MLEHSQTEAMPETRRGCILLTHKYVHVKDRPGTNINSQFQFIFRKCSKFWVAGKHSPRPHYFFPPIYLYFFEVLYLLVLISWFRQKMPMCWFDPTCRDWPSERLRARIDCRWERRSVLGHSNGTRNRRRNTAPAQRETHKIIKWRNMSLTLVKAWN